MGMESSRKTLSYGVGALAVLVASLGCAAVVYGLPLLAFNLLNLPAWILGPVGAYTLAYAVIAGKDATYYLVWGSITFAIALISALYTLLNPFVIVGVLAVIIAIIGILAYQRSKK
ncbi:MAG: hypothetical protein NWF09_03475 [Candidatus Bathyarchaeota archaeon]|nr:hypothetical protein [Candidatus Bathyarchaeota archaeon]